MNHLKNNIEFSSKSYNDVHILNDEEQMTMMPNTKAVHFAEDQDVHPLLDRTSLVRKAYVEYSIFHTVLTAVAYLFYKMFQ